MWQNAVLQLQFLGEQDWKLSVRSQSQALTTGTDRPPPFTTHDIILDFVAHFGCGIQLRESNATITNQRG